MLLILVLSGIRAVHWWQSRRGVGLNHLHRMLTNYRLSPEPWTKKLVLRSICSSVSEASVLIIKLEAVRTPQFYFQS